MVAAVAIENIQSFNRIEMVLLSVGGENLRHAGIETATENSGQAGALEALTVCPLPGIFEMRFVRRLVIGGVEVADPCSQTGFHNG